MMSLTGALTEAPPAFGQLQNALQNSAAKSATTISTSGSSSSSKWKDDAEHALTTLKQVASHSDRHVAVKAAAAQKLVLLKSQLKTLDMFGMDPKKKAQEAGRIAREIGDAAKEYSQAGGSADAATATSSTAVSPVAAAAAASAAPSTVASDAIKSNPLAATIVSAFTANPVAKPTSPGAQASGSSSQPGRSSSRSADLAFISEARLLARKANAMIQAAIQEATRKKEQTVGIAREGEKALTSVDIAAFALGLGQGVSGVISAGYGASARSISLPPAASIKVVA